MFNDFEILTMFKAKMEELEGYIKEQSFVHTPGMPQKKQSLFEKFSKEIKIQKDCQTCCC